MHYSAYLNAEKFYNKYCEDNIENKKILDVGSYDVNGTMKPIFQKGKYVGLDMEKGPNVDIVGVSHQIPFEKDEFDIVISSSCSFIIGVPSPFTTGLTAGAGSIFGAFVEAESILFVVGWFKTVPSIE